jgi:hypothetical protein
MSDLEDAANKRLTNLGQVPEPAEAQSSEGTPQGQPQDGSAQAEGVSKPDPGNAAGTAASGSLEPALASVLAHAAGITDSLPVTHCSNCEIDVRPKGKGMCPKCGRMLKGAFLARKTPRNVLRRDQLHAEIVAEYKPDTWYLRRACRWLANIDERLETVKDGTPEHTRLIGRWTELTSTLEASRSRQAPSINLEDLDPDEVVAHAERVLEMARLARDAQRTSDAYLAQAPPLGVSPRPEPNDAPAESLIPQPEPLCPYCHQSITRCAEIKTTRLDAWQALHHNDPSEIERRGKLATAEMYESLRRHGPARY